MTTLQITQEALSKSAESAPIIEYTPFILFLLGLAGIFLHNAIKLNQINKRTKGNANIGYYLKMEVYSIIIAVVIVAISIIVAHEIQSLYNAGIKIGLAFIAIGYMGQSLLVAWMGKAEKIIGRSDKDN